jgi:hypothetical protein
MPASRGPARPAGGGDGAVPRGGKAARLRRGFYRCGAGAQGISAAARGPTGRGYWTGAGACRTASAWAAAQEQAGRETAAERRSGRTG